MYGWQRWVNEVNQRWARLVQGWVTVFGRVNHLGMQPANWVDSAFHFSGAVLFKYR